MVNCVLHILAQYKQEKFTCRIFIMVMAEEGNLPFLWFRDICFDSEYS